MKTHLRMYTRNRGLPLQDIIVCASLIDKIPNLAGLARTCEIFGASKLVVPNMRLTKDPQFEGISISAAQWIHIEVGWLCYILDSRPLPAGVACMTTLVVTQEVLEKDTSAFLQRCRMDGYVVVGLEQTSTSQCITKTQLPEKMVLLLGKEKEGIPVDLLAEVDRLIEIPQLGVCRSLNVHVSGALLIWEYTRQHMMRQQQQQPSSSSPTVATGGRLNGNHSKAKLNGQCEGLVAGPGNR